MIVICELFQVNRNIIDNPSGNIEVLLGTDSSSLLLKDVPNLRRSPFMRDLSLASYTLSDFFYIKQRNGIKLGGKKSKDAKFL